MSENERTDHMRILASTGRHKLTDEQEDTIRKLMGDLTLDIEEDCESTLELPQIGSTK